MVLSDGSDLMEILISTNVPTAPGRAQIDHERCWHCGKVTIHEIAFHEGKKSLVCKECDNLVVEKL
jgi:hypothetical protein